MQKIRLIGMNGFFALMLVFTAGIARGQQAGYLILVDAEDKQPFTARIGETLLPSSSHGHLLFPHLEDSSYRVIIGFPNKNIPEQVFPVVMHKKDQGLQLRGADSSWVLYNWQSKQTIYPIKEVDSSRLLDQGVKREDGFSRLMAAVVNDSSVMYNTYTFEKPSTDTLSGKAEDSSAMIVKDRKSLGTMVKDSAGMVRNRKKPEANTAKTKKSEIKEVVAKSKIKKLREVSLKISRKIVFLDISQEGVRDTVTLFVYYEKPEIKKKSHEDPMVTARRLLRNDTIHSKTAHAGKEKQSITENTYPPTGEKQKDTLTGEKPVPITAKITAASRDSSSGMQLAGDAEMESLRSAILTANTEHEKIGAASAAFSQKRYSVSQVRLLARLFVADRAIYKFLEAAQGHLSEPEHFHELGDLLTDKTYLKKFSKLAGKRG